MADMICQECHHNVSQAEQDLGYCSACGAILKSHAYNVPLANMSMQELTQAVSELQQQNRALTERLHTLEQHVAQWPVGAAFPPKKSVAPVRVEEEPPIPIAERELLPSITETVVEEILIEVSPLPEVSELSAELVQGLIPQAIETHSVGQTAATRQAVNLEEDIGLKWFSRIGIVALVLGVGLLIRLALVNHLVGYGTQIVLGVMVGLGMVVGGHKITRWESYIHWGRTLIGGGFALTYFLIYAAYHFENYRTATGLNQWVDIILLTLVVVGAIGMALWHNSRVIASGAFFLGYTTAFLSGSYDLQTLVYAMVLSVGVVLIAIQRQWGDMGFASMVISYGFFALCQTMQPQQPWVGLGLLLLIFNLYIEMSGRLKATVVKTPLINACVAMNLTLAFLLAFTLFHKQDPLALTLFAGVYGLLFMRQLFRWVWDADSPTPQAMGSLLVWQGCGICLLLTWPWPPLGAALAYGGLYALARWRLPPVLPPLLAYLAVGYLSLSVLLLVDPAWITLMWIVESTLLVIVSYKLNIRALRLSHYALDGVITNKLLFWDLWQAYVSGEALAPLQGGLTGAAILSFYAIGFYLQRHPQLLEDREKIAPVGYVGVATVAVLFLSTFYFTISLLTLAWILLTLGFLALAHYWPTFRALQFYFYALSALVLGKCWLMDVRAVSHRILPLTWWETAIYGLLALTCYGLVWYGHQRFKDLLGTFAIAVYAWCATGLVGWLTYMWLDGIALTAVWLVLLFVALGLFDRQPQHWLIRWHVYLGAIVLVGKFMIGDGYLGESGSLLRPGVALGIVAWLYVCAYLFERHLQPTAVFTLPVDENWTPTALGVLGTLTLLSGIALELDSYWISIGWAVAGFGLLYGGFALAHKTLRLHGLAVLSLTIAKVFVWDIFSMDPLSRTLSFIVLGVLLLGAAFVYSRYRERLKGLI